LTCALSLAAGCGRKTAPRPAELVRPERIATLTASRSAEGVVLTWRRPEKYVDGSHMDDLGRFVIERSDNDGPFQALATLPVEDRDRFRKIRRLRYTDTTAIPGTLHRYRILSATIDDYVSAPSNVAQILLNPPPPIRAPVNP
jgi:hypothetical protein